MKRGWKNGMACLGTGGNREGDAVLQKLANNTEVSRIVC